jgi:uncharacterized membrane protein YgdD (TMEM256/DUF423 family)
MQPLAKLFISLGAAFAALAVALGAFGAHALKDRLSPEMLGIYHTGIEYQFYHALGLLVVGILSRSIADSTALQWSGTLMVAGIVLFSGSLYALTLSGERWLGAVTPVGGVAFIAAWICLIVAVSGRR